MPIDCALSARFVAVTITSSICAVAVDAAIAAITAAVITPVFFAVGNTFIRRSLIILLLATLA